MQTEHAIEQGCYVYGNGAGLRVSGYRTSIHDAVGAGDAFSATYLHGFQQGWSTPLAAQFANAVGSLVVSRQGATPQWSLDQTLAICGSVGQ